MDERQIEMARAEALIFKQEASIFVRKLRAYRDMEDYDAANSVLHQIARTTKIATFRERTEDVILIWAGAPSFAGVYRAFNNYVGWLQDCMVQCDLVGQTLSYVVMPIDTVLPLGGLIEPCPRCGLVLAMTCVKKCSQLE